MQHGCRSQRRLIETLKHLGSTRGRALPASSRPFGSHMVLCASNFPLLPNAMILPQSAIFKAMEGSWMSTFPPGIPEPTSAALLDTPPTASLEAARLIYQSTPPGDRGEEWVGLNPFRGDEAQNMSPTPRQVVQCSLHTCIAGGPQEWAMRSAGKLKFASRMHNAFDVDIALYPVPA